MSQSVSGDTFGEPSTSQRVIEAVAETTDADLTEVGPLYHTIDPDALDRLFSPTSGSGRANGYVEFTFAGCDVVVRGSGEIEVTERGVSAGISEEADVESDRVRTEANDR